jgi:hypothetical protein
MDTYSNVLLGYLKKGGFSSRCSIILYVIKYVIVGYTETGKYKHHVVFTVNKQNALSRNQRQPKWGIKLDHLKSDEQ